MKNLFYWLAAINLVVLASGATPLHKYLPSTGKLIHFFYRSTTGAGAGFGFFSPNVSNQLQISFEVTHKDKSVKTIFLESLLRHETRIRVGNMFRVFTHHFKNEKLRKSLAASYAASVFEKIPEAEKVKFIAQAFKWPSLKGYRDGERAQIIPVYSITFAKNKS